MNLLRSTPGLVLALVLAAPFLLPAQEIVPVGAARTETPALAPPVASVAPVEQTYAPPSIPDNSQPDSSPTPARSRAYLLAPNDVVDIKVYHEDDLETKARISQDGTISFPLIGVAPIGGKTIEQAEALLRQRLDKRYLINPQITMMVVEYSKRRFTVLGQVEKPGSFEIPSEEAVTLIEAIAMAGGYTRLADQAHVRVARMVGDRMETVSIDTKRQSDDGGTTGFQVLPDDTVTVPERFF